MYQCLVTILSVTVQQFPRECFLSRTGPIFPRATLFTMADPSWSNCSISQQDCAKYNNITYQNLVPFTSSSCVPYPPWYQGDQGVCGWKGAPCTTSSGGYSNCSASIFLSHV